MQIRLLAQDGPVDGPLEAFIRTMVGFATWHYPRLVDRVDVHLVPVESCDGDRRVRCELAAWTTRGDCLSTCHEASERHEAVQQAANLLEVSLHPTSGLRGWATPQPAAA